MKYLSITYNTYLSNYMAIGVDSLLQEKPKCEMAYTRN